MTPAGLRFSVGLPHNLPDVGGPELVGWATRAEDLGFSALATTDRLVYRGHECLVTLGLVAGVTERIRLMTSVLIGPVHSNTALLAKQAATLDAVSGGRLTLGLAVGARPDDFAASGVDPRTRGRALDAQIDEMRAIWGGARRGIAGPVGPSPVTPGGPALVLGGQSPAAWRRVVTKGTGWVSGGAGPGAFAAGITAIREIARKQGGEFTGPTSALVYTSLGADADEWADRFVQDYYGFAPPLAQRIRQGVVTSQDGLARAATAFAGHGCEELVLVPCSPSPDTLTLAAEVVGDVVAV